MPRDAPRRPLLLERPALPTLRESRLLPPPTRAHSNTYTRGRPAMPAMPCDVRCC